MAGQRLIEPWVKELDKSALTTVVVPWLVDRMVEGVTWQAMAWWIHDNLPYSELQFFPNLLAFNI